MVENEIPVGKGCTLKTVLDKIPTNTVLNKTICGIGATWLEIEAERHSIIIEPNVPVIEGKLKEHSNLFGVKEGVSAEDITNYINENKEFIKLMTTPESFGKVKKALSELYPNYRKDFFLLFDECDKIVEDIDFRSTIALPVDEFFKFKNKAMVSATPVIPVDPRFEEQDFQMLTVKPDYDHKRDLYLYPTNNTYNTLRKILDSIEPDNKEPICIFFNSTDGIDEIISLLGVKDESKIYCGTESVEKLRERGYKSVSDSLFTDSGKIKLNRYNFFTSRFHSAVDIKIDSKPIIILLTELFLAPHSKIDARTDAIQIAGRFRKGISNYIHITNYNRDLIYRGRKAVEDFLDGQHNIYTEFRKKLLYSRRRGERHILEEFLNTTSYRKYATDTGEKNYFAYHNAFVEDELKGFYQYPSKIQVMYNKTGAFNVSSQNIYSVCSDKERRLLQSKSKPQKLRNRLAFYQITKLLKSTKKDKYDIKYLQQLQSEYGLIFEAIRVIGIENMAKRNFDFRESAIRHNIAAVQQRDELLRPEIVKEVHAHFDENTWHTTKEINSTLTAIYIRNGITLTKRVEGKYITAYFVADRQRKRVADGWMLGKRKSVRR